MGTSRILSADEADKFRAIPQPVFSQPVRTVFGSVRSIIEGELAVDEHYQPIESASTETYEQLAKQRPPRASTQEEQAPAISEEERHALRNAAKEEGLRLGMEEGHKLGFEDGKQQGKDEYASQIAQMKDILNALETRVNEQDLQLDSELSELTASMARRVVQRELQLHPNHILEAVKQGLATLPSQQGHVRLFLHSEDLKNINENLIDGDSEHSWTLIEDPDINLGSYRIESGSAELSFDLNKRLKEVIDAALIGPTPRTPI